jgi:glycosyltransferase involved in cell wall biosynthesis
VLLEAMAAGKANIITDSAAIRDYVDPDVTAVVVPPRDPAALRAAMQSLLRDEPRRKHIGEAAGEAARQRFDHASMWSHIAATLHDVLGASSDAPAP